MASICLIKKRLLFVIISFFIGVAVFAFAANANKPTPEEDARLKALKEKVALEKKVQSKENAINTIKGTVVRLDYRQGIIIVKNGNDVKMSFYIVRNETVLTNKGNNIALSNIMPGDNLDISYYIDSTGTVVATQVNVINAE